ncbi:MAG: hypothetical protein LBU61_05140 [Coriobacteriales bacterium]|jgi:hypothetical protein|nr:hypothetical protein [Coriobacteriales bacterium]
MPTASEFQPPEIPAPAAVTAIPDFLPTEIPTPAVSEYLPPPSLTPPAPTQQFDAAVPPPAQQYMAPSTAPAQDYVPAPAPDYVPAPAPDYVSAPAPDYVPAPAPDYSSTPAQGYAPAQPPDYASAQPPDYAPAPQPVYDRYPSTTQQSQQPQQMQSGYSQPQPGYSQPQPGYSQPQQISYDQQPYSYQAPPKKNKTWLIFVIIGVLIVAALSVGGILIWNLLNTNNNGGGGGSGSGGGGGGGGTSTSLGWTGGINSSELPRGYTAIVSNDRFIIGVGEIRPYNENDGTTTLQVDLYIINKSRNALYLLFRDNTFDGVSAPYDMVFVSVLRTEPYDTDQGVVYIECLRYPEDLNNWKGTLYIVDDDTFYDANPVFLQTIDFNLTFRW